MEEIVKKEQASMNDIFLYLKAKSNSLYKFVILYNHPKTKGFILTKWYVNNNVDKTAEEIKARFYIN